MSYLQDRLEDAETINRDADYRLFLDALKDQPLDENDWNEPFKMADWHTSGTPFIGSRIAEGPSPSVDSPFNPASLAAYEPQVTTRIPKIHQHQSAERR